ncbi:twin-arginine translocase TatA/TatE family subunit [Pseudoclavibacter alba]|uniref:Sec-independent protein translocase protein TatA n=1 Tax=Pseudoclavibacter albus TaxID=272241 RepID=A0ABT2HXI8_9MICO|nr:twin-arginine translocase TatA/TatE family subunit [Pseudoclavibacter alba]MCT2042856.1 twin-arginine translocase TatA/TatE family subunit [Pseudoclavibacter alba]
MFQGFGGWHLIAILFLVLLLFGAPKLPALAKSLGQSMRIFRGEMRQMQDESPKQKKDGEAAPAATTAPAAPSEPVTPNTAEPQPKPESNA